MPSTKPDTRRVAADIANGYCKMSAKGIETLSSLLQPIAVAKGERLLDEGQVCSSMYYVERGMVRQFYYKGNRDVTEHFSYEGRIVICIESFILQEPSRLMVEALEPSMLYGIPHDRLHRLMEVDAEIEHFYRKVLEHALISSQEHADSQRFENASERYLRLLRNKPAIVLRAPLAYVASFLQMTPETLSRVRSAHVD